MGHEISSGVNVSPSLLTKDQILYLSPSLPASVFFSLSCWPLYLAPVSVSVLPLEKARGCVHTEMRETPAQSHLGRERAECHQEPPLSYTWGAPAMEGGYAALHANRCWEPSACHLTQGHRNTGVWFTWRVSTLLCKHVFKDCDFLSCVVSVKCALVPANIEMTFHDISCNPCVIKLT